LTAFILRHKTVVCPICEDHFRLDTNAERILSSQLVSAVLKYACILLLTLAFVVVALMIDAYMKARRRNEAFKFSLISWIVLVPFAAVLAIIVLWCFY